MVGRTLTHPPDAVASERGSEAARLWDFAVRLYARPGLDAACLRLQDRGGLDVPLLLMCVWAGYEGPGRLAPEALEAARELGCRWGRDVIAPLRAARRALKHAGLGVEEPRLALREQVIAAEREAERAALQAMAGVIPTGTGAAAGRDGARDNVTAYLTSLGLDRLPWVAGDIDVLLRAADELR